MAPHLPNNMKKGKRIIYSVTTRKLEADTWVNILLCVQVLRLMLLSVGSKQFITLALLDYSWSCKTNELKLRYECLFLREYNWLYMLLITNVNEGIF